MTTLSKKDILKIAHLARLSVTEQEISLYTQQLSNILNFVEQMNDVNTDNIEPLAHSFEDSLRLRDDIVTEVDHRDAFQAIAPQTEAGLYLVPKVIDAELVDVE